jgi:hypothetical protein
MSWWMKKASGLMNMKNGLEYEVLPHNLLDPLYRSLVFNNSYVYLEENLKKIPEYVLSNGE